MANTTKQEKNIKELFLGECWMFLRSNFSKFSEVNKIKIALALAMKDIPQEVQGMNLQQVVMMSEIKRGLEPLRFNIGDKINVADPS